MKSKTFRFHVGKEQIRKISDPYGHKRDRYIALVQVRHLPADLPLDVNPRNQDTGSRVSKQIGESLIDNPQTFHLKNRGLAVITRGIEYDNRSQVLSLTIPEGSQDYGVLDGGHTYQVIRELAEKSASDEESKEPAFLDAHVTLEIMEGLPDDLIVDIARARNTSAQVKGFSLANLENKFEWIKQAVSGEKFASRIAYRENEDDTLFPIDIMEIVGFATMIHPLFQDADNPPILAYSGKGRALDMFANEEHQAGYVSVAPVLVDTLKLYDHIHLNFARMYEEIGGFSGLGQESSGTKHKVKLGKVSEVKQYKDGFELFYLGKRGEYRFPDGWLYPVVGAMRALIDYKPVRTTWKTDPFEFFNRHGKKLVTMTLEAGKQLGRTPAAIGKNKPHWVQLHDRVSLIASRAGIN